MLRHRSVVWFLGLGLVGPALAQTEPGDYLIVSRTYGTIYAVDPATGLIRGLVSGLELRDLSGRVRGQGPTLDGSYRTSLDVVGNGTILARFSQSEKSFGLAVVDPAFGHRTLLPGTDQPLWKECGDIIVLDDGTVFATADDWPGGEGTEGRVLRYDVDQGTTTLISGPGMGDGPVLKLPRALALLDENTLLVAEWNRQPLPPPFLGAGLFKVNLQNGDRTFLSRLVPQPFYRQVIVNGAPGDEWVLLGDDEGGDGPVADLQSRSIAVIDGRVLLAEAIQLPDSSYNGGILDVDRVTGDRTLLVGQALADDGTGGTVITVLPSNWDPNEPVFLDAPMGLLETDSGRLAFTCLFGPNSIFEYDLATAELFEIANLEDQLDPIFVDSVRLSGLAVCRTHFQPGDLDGDGDVDQADLGILLADWGCSGGDCPGDCDGDTDTDQADLGILLANWGAGG